MKDYQNINLLLILKKYKDALKDTKTYFETTEPS